MLEQAAAEVSEERNSRKEPLSESDAQSLIDAVETVWVAKGRKVLEKASGETRTDDLKGPTGNFRAPMVRIGNDLLVGFNAEALERLVVA